VKIQPSEENLGTRVVDIKKSTGGNVKRSLYITETRVLVGG
jgi:hypothetical protein